MKTLNTSLLLESISIIPEVQASSDQPTISKYHYLFNLLTEDYIAPEHLAVPESDWDEFESFLCALLGQNIDNPHAEIIRRKVKNSGITQWLGQLLTQIPSVPTDDFI